MGEPMIPDQEAYLALTRQIVAEVMPEEQIAFDLAAANIADELYRSGSADGGARGGNEFQFIETATTVLNFVSLMVGTFEAVRRLWKSLRKKKPVAEGEVAESWRRELRSAGLSEEAAAVIVVKFEKDLAALVTGSPGQPSAS